MSKQFLAILGILILGFAGFIIFAGKDGKSTTNGDGQKVVAQASEHKKGQGTKNVTLLEYGDFQCPSCAQYYPIIEEVVKKYKDEIIFQFRHYPITQIHPNAMVAHRAAEAAAKQNKFWGMYDLLYQRQQIWSQSNNPVQVMDDYATELGINVERFQKDFKSAEVNAIINADKEKGDKAGVKGTPSFFINNKELDLKNIKTPEDFNKKIDEAIKSTNQ